MKKLIFILGIISIFAFASVAMAVPNLQIDLSDGTYDYVSESVTTVQGDFTVYALLSNADYLADTFYLSVAVYPGVDVTTPKPDLGSFTVAYQGSSTLYNVTENMNWGFAPYEGFEEDAKDGGDLSPHSVFPTYFLELAFNFNSADTTGEYNTQDDPGTIGTHPVDGLTDMYYVAFDFTNAYLSDGDLHFDLYNTIIKEGDIDRGIFAPFSHDGQTRVPEPGTLVLLGIGILGVAVYRRKMT